MSEPIDVQLPAIPDHVPRDTIQAFCNSLGLPGVRELHFDMDDVTATLLLRNSDGHKFQYGDDAATTTVTIPIR